MPTWVRRCIHRAPQKEPALPRPPGSPASFKSPELWSCPRGPCPHPSCKPLHRLLASAPTVHHHPAALCSVVASAARGPMGSASFLVSEHSSLPGPPAPNRNCAPIALKLLSPSLPPAGTARYPYPGHSILPTLCPQQRRPAPAYSRCSVRIGQMVNSRDRRWGGAWERRGRCVRVSAVLSPHLLAVKAAPCRKYLES